jgi:hypothetical protein
MPGTQSGNARKSSQMFFESVCSDDIKAPVLSKRSRTDQKPVPSLPGVVVKPKRSAVNVCRSINHWLEIMALWQKYQLQHIRLARAKLMAADPLRREVAADEVSGPSLDLFAKALREGYADDGGRAWRRSGGVGCIVANADSYATLGRSLLSEKIKQHALQLLQPNMKTIVSIESRLLLLNESLGRTCSIQPPPMVRVVYNKVYPFLGYHLEATGSLEEGVVVDFYQGVIRSEEPYNKFLRDPEYAHRLSPSLEDRRGMYFRFPKVSYDVIDSTDPLSCYARYICCSLDPSKEADNVELVYHEWARDAERLSVVVTKPIVKGEVLKFYYGLQYWGTVLSMMSINNPRRGEVKRLLEGLENVESGRSGGPLLGTHDASDADSDYTAND